MADKKVTSIREQLEKYKQILEGRQKYVKNEYQSYGLELAKFLGDWNNRSLYIRLAKTIDRQILEKARLFIKDQTLGTIKTPYKLFMWKLKELRTQGK